MHNSLFKQANPLIDESSDETLTNIQAMLARIQALCLDIDNTPSKTQPESGRSFCPANELYLRLLMLVKDAIEHEIKKRHKN